MGTLITIWLVNTFLIIATVLIHYEFLYQLTNIMPKLKMPHRFRMILAVLGTLVAHVVEVWLFGVVYYVLLKFERFGALAGNISDSILDCVYFSFTNYTTLGYGDIEPIGDIRFVTGIESLTGLLMITWTASFLYLEMSRYWEARSQREVVAEQSE